MKKSELKSGMRVFTKQGNEYLVINDYCNNLCYRDVLCNMNNDSFMPLEDYNEDLECEVDKFTICEVYSPKSLNAMLSRDMNDFELIWEQKELIKLTQFEYDLLHTEMIHDNDSHFIDSRVLCHMRNIGYFTDIVTASLLREILGNCEVINDEK